MDKKFKYSLPFVAALMVVIGMIVGSRMKPLYKVNQETDPKKKFEEVLRDVESAYVDTPREAKLTDAAIEAMLRELDPHSVYIPAKDLAETNEELEGSFEGVGIEFNMLNDTIIVVSPISGGPSEAVGIHAGDKIIKIDGRNAAGVHFSTEDVMKHLRGAKGTSVKVSIQRGNSNRLLEFTIHRDKIPLYTIEAAYMAAPGIGYIKINRFGATTLEEYAEAMKKLKKQGLKNLVLDLTNNPGGYLRAAIMLADEFLDNGKLIVYTKGRARPKDIYKSTGEGQFEHGRLAILVDEGSASASEIVSGAIQDQDRGLIVGRRSFGKGLVQEPFMLSDGSAIRLTVARYYTPSGRSIQRPYSKGSDEYYEDLGNRIKHGELESKDSIHFNDSLKYYTSRHRVVYGGGGIMPDVFVPLDTSDNSEYLHNLAGKGIFNDFVTYYMENNRDKMKTAYPNFAAFHQNFNIDEAFMQQFVTYAAKMGVKPDAKGIKASSSFIKLELKALIARNIYHNEGFYHIINEQNSILRKAIEVLQSSEYKKMKLID